MIITHPRTSCPVLSAAVLLIHNEDVSFRLTLLTPLRLTLDFTFIDFTFIVVFFTYLFMLDRGQAAPCQDSVAIFPELSLMGHSSDPDTTPHPPTGGQICRHLHRFRQGNRVGSDGLLLQVLPPSPSVLAPLRDGSAAGREKRIFRMSFGIC